MINKPADLFLPLCDLTSSLQWVLKVRKAYFEYIFYSSVLQDFKSFSLFSGYPNGHSLFSKVQSIFNSVRAPWV